MSWFACFAAAAAIGYITRALLVPREVNKKMTKEEPLSADPYGLLGQLEIVRNARFGGDMRPIQKDTPNE